MLYWCQYIGHCSCNRAIPNWASKWHWYFDLSSPMFFPSFSLIYFPSFFFSQNRNKIFIFQLIFTIIPFSHYYYYLVFILSILLLLLSVMVAVVKRKNPKSKESGSNSRFRGCVCVDMFVRLLYSTLIVSFTIIISRFALSVDFLTNSIEPKK